MVASLVGPDRADKVLWGVSEDLPGRVGKGRTDGSQLHSASLDVLLCPHEGTLGARCPGTAFSCLGIGI